MFTGWILTGVVLGYAADPRTERKVFDSGMAAFAAGIGDTVNCIPLVERHLSPVLEYVSSPDIRGADHNAIGQAVSGYYHSLTPFIASERLEFHATGKYPPGGSVHCVRLIAYNLGDFLPFVLVAHHRSDIEHVRSQIPLPISEMNDLLITLGDSFTRDDWLLDSFLWFSPWLSKDTEIFCGKDPEKILYKYTLFIRNLPTANGFTDEELMSLSLERFADGISMAFFNGCAATGDASQRRDRFMKTRTVLDDPWESHHISLDIVYIYFCSASRDDLLGFQINTRGLGGPGTNYIKPIRQWFAQLAAALVSDEYRVFTKSSTGAAHIPTRMYMEAWSDLWTGTYAPAREDLLIRADRPYRFTGQLMAKAFCEGTPFPIRFATSFYKEVLSGVAGGKYGQTMQHVIDGFYSVIPHDLFLTMKLTPEDLELLLVGPLDHHIRFGGNDASKLDEIVASMTDDELGQFLSFATGSSLPGEYTIEVVPVHPRAPRVITADTLELKLYLPQFDTAAQLEESLFATMKSGKVGLGYTSEERSSFDDGMNEWMNILRRFRDADTTEIKISDTVFDHFISPNGYVGDEDRQDMGNVLSDILGVLGQGAAKELSENSEEYYVRHLLTVSRILHRKAAAQVKIRSDAADILNSVWAKALSGVSSEKEVVFSIIDSYVLMHSVVYTRSFCQTMESLMHIYLFGYQAGRVWKYKRESGLVVIVTRECGFMGDYLTRVDQLAISLKGGVAIYPSANGHPSIRLWHNLEWSINTFSATNYHRMRRWHIENAKPWFRYIAGELIKPESGLFQETTGGMYSLAFGLASILPTNNLYRFTGQFLAKALLEKETLQIRFERSLYEQILRGVDAYTTVDIGSVFRYKINNPILDGFYELIPHADLRSIYISPAELALALEG